MQGKNMNNGKLKKKGKYERKSIRSREKRTRGIVGPELACGSIF